MNAQRLRNLTTGILHTKMEDIYEDVEFLTGAVGVMTHQLPNAFEALKPWLREKVTDPRFFDDKHDPSHDGEINIAPMTESESGAFWLRYGALPSPFAAFA